MIAILGAALILATDTDIPSLTPVDTFDLSCVESSLWVMAHSSTPQDKDNAFSITAFYLGRLSGRYPGVNWIPRIQADVPTLSRDADWHAKIVLNCLPAMQEIMRFSN